MRCIRTYGIWLGLRESEGHRCLAFEAWQGFKTDLTGTTGACCTAGTVVAVAPADAAQIRRAVYYTAVFCEGFLITQWDCCNISPAANLYIKALQNQIFGRLTLTANGCTVSSKAYQMAVIFL